MKEDAKFFNVQEFNEKYDIRVQFFEYLGCINVIRANLREHNLYNEDGHFKEHTKVYDVILNSPMRGSKLLMIFCLEELKFLTQLGKDIEWKKGFCRY